MTAKWRITSGAGLDMGTFEAESAETVEYVETEIPIEALENRLVVTNPGRSRENPLAEAASEVPVYIAVEFDLARGERTGKQMVFDATSLDEATKKLAYTLNLSRAGWRVSPSGRTVGRMSGDIGWHLVKAGSPAARNMGASEVQS